MTPQNMETAPKDGSWVLAYDPVRARQKYVPWVAMTWGDKGWVDDSDHPCSPSEWVRFPDPQPTLTGWRPASGTIRIEPASWRDKDGNVVTGLGTHTVFIMRDDGEYDEYRDTWPARDLADARRRAEKWRQQFGLPVVEAPTPPLRLVSNSGGGTRVEREAPEPPLPQEGDPAEVFERHARWCAARDKVDGR